MSGLDNSDEQERRELNALLWFFWAGIIFATIGESVLVFLMKSNARGASGLQNSNTIVVAALAVGMWGLIAAIYRKKLGGGGMPTALFCWMLAKGSAILGFVMYFLEPGWGYTWMLLVGFLTIMGLLQPPKFLPQDLAVQDG